jgi:hypothetical protein
VAYIGAKGANDPPVSPGWKRYEGVVAIPPETKRIVIAPPIYGPGTVRFDDLDAEYTNDPATDPIGSWALRSLKAYEPPGVGKHRVGDEALTTTRAQAHLQHHNIASSVVART